MTTLDEIKKALKGVTPGPWKAVSEPHFDSGLVYTSVQPVNIDEEAMKSLAMANGEYHVCRMSHSAAPWRFNYHRRNAQYIAAVNPEAISELLSTLESLQRENEELRNGPPITGKWKDDERAKVWEYAFNKQHTRAEAAEAEVKRYREALIAAKTRMRNCRGAIESDQVVDKDVHGSLQNGIRDIQEALSSTGYTHGN